MDEFFKKLRLEIEPDISQQGTQKLAKTFEKSFSSDPILSRFGKMWSTGAQAAAGLANGRPPELIAANIIEQTVDDAIATIENLISEIKSSVNEMTQYGLMSDESVRNLKLTYGFSSSEAYGYQKAMDIMGFSSMEDLMYANETQLEYFNEAFDKYSDYYMNTMTPEFVNKQIEYQTEMEMFKQDMLNNVVEFFMDNQDVIMGAMDALMVIADVVLDIADWLFSMFRSREYQSNDVFDKMYGSQTYNNKTANINMNNTYNGVSKEDGSMINQYNQAMMRQMIAAFE